MSQWFQQQQIFHNLHSVIWIPGSHMLIRKKTIKVCQRGAVFPGHTRHAGIQSLLKDISAVIFFGLIKFKWPLILSFIILAPRDSPATMEHWLISAVLLTDSKTLISSWHCSIFIICTDWTLTRQNKGRWQCVKTENHIFIIQMCIALKYMQLTMNENEWMNEAKAMSKGCVMVQFWSLPIQAAGSTYCIHILSHAESPLHVVNYCIRIHHILHCYVPTEKERAIVQWQSTWFVCRRSSFTSWPLRKVGKDSSDNLKNHCQVSVDIPKLAEPMDPVLTNSV